MINLHIHHIGYLVKKIERGIDAFTSLGYEKETEIIFDDYRGINICFMIKDGYRVELVSPQNKDSVVYNLMKKIGNNPYHICYLCNDLFEAIDDMRNQGFVKYDEPHEASAIKNKKVCFMIHPYLGMIELLEEDKDVF